MLLAEQIRAGKKSIYRLQVLVVLLSGTSLYFVA